MSGRLRPPGRRCLPALGVVAALLAAAIGPALIPTVAGAAGPSLTRDPYITDATSTNATVDFATNTQSPAPVVTWGPSGGGSPCTGSATPAPAGTAITVNGKAEFQFAAALTGLVPDAGYCYRVTQGGVDLLGTRKSPGFTSARASGAAGAFRFAVIGDWGAGTSSEANVLQHMTTSSPRFVITVGDNAYPSGSETEYGDRSGGHVFAPSYWPVLGGGVPAFLAQGNHGFATYQPLLTDWPQGSTVAACATTGCRYTSAAYPSLDGSRAATYANAWYAFDVGNARFYVLEAAWDDANVGSAGAYKLDYDAHWNPTNGAAEYQWLKADLAAHGSTPLKFAFFHYPLRVDGGAASDTRLQGTSQSTLEGLLAGNSVDIVFNGHAHIYERNLPQVPGSPMVNYVTGGGGDAVGPLKTCSSFDAYALGGAGTSCKAPKPTSDKQVHNFLQVDVNGANVTVTPTDETGRTFDVQSYNFTERLIQQQAQMISANATRSLSMSV